MKSSRIHTLMITNLIILLLILLPTSKSESQNLIPSSGLLCVSDCDTCPVVCSPPSSPPTSPPPPPPTTKHHHSPPESAHPAPKPPSEGEAVPPPPEIYVYTPAGPGMVQQNFSYPYYYFYTSKAATCSTNSLHQGLVFFVFFVFLQVLYACR